MWRRENKLFATRFPKQMRRALLLSVILLPAVALGAASRKPPLGWSSWYALGQSVNQSAMEETFVKLTSRSVKPGDSRSLRDVGWTYANLDDGWQACGQGVDGSFHDADGFPLMDKKKFPNVTAMTGKAHSLGLLPGFYVNNYICGAGECKGGVGGQQYHRVMHSTVTWLKTNGFKYLKVDSGGCYNDMQLWHDLIHASGQDIRIENCHQGGEPPNATWCPYDLWRVGGDVNGMGPDNEILLVQKALKNGFPRAGCWPYPDFMSFRGNGDATRSLFGTYAIMGTPMVMSFDIRDDNKLLPLWDILTNEEIIAVNQDDTAATGTLISKFSVHSADAPEYLWAEVCNSSEPLQSGWRYDAGSKQVTWGTNNDALLCLDGTLGQDLALLDCGKPSSKGAQSWVLSGSRLWQADDSRWGDAVGDLSLVKCGPPKQHPGQQWSYSPGGATTNVQVNLTHRLGGCWEITGCQTADDASVGTTYGCKPVPQPGDQGCDLNGAWSFNPGNRTITSVMSGKCLEAHTGSNAIEVSACTSEAKQQWTWAAGDASGKANGQVQSVERSGQCVDMGAVPAPAGTNGNCCELTHGTGGDGPGVNLVNPSSNGSPCEPSNRPKATEAFSLDGGRLTVGNGQCIAARRGKPNPFGPLQLWAKQLAAGAAVLFVNRANDGGVVSVDVALADLPGVEGFKAKSFVVRDAWKHEDVGKASSDGKVVLSAGPQSSTFYVLKPAAEEPLRAPIELIVSPDGPYRNLRDARDALREIRRENGVLTKATISIAPGVYALNETLVLQEEDSNVAWRSLAGSHSRPRHSGGRVLNGTWAAPTEKGEPWVLRLAPGTPHFNQLFVDGDRAIRAREPEHGSFFQMQAQLPAPNTGKGFVWKGTDLVALAGSEGVDAAELVIYDSWMAGRRNVKSISVINRSVALTSGARISIEPYANSGSRYYAENYAAACDSPNEWFLKRSQAPGEPVTLLWQPRHADEDPNTLQFVAPVIIGDLLRIENASGVSIDGQTFEHVDWTIARTNVSSGECQAASFLNTAAVHLRNATGCSITNVTIEHVGEYGLWLEGASSHNNITGTMVRDSGAGGMRVGTGKPLMDKPDGSDYNQVIDSTFVLGSNVYHEGNGILIQKVSHTLVRRCEVAFYEHSGISVGWTWDYEPTQANSNLVDECHVHHLGNGELSDLAGIYFLGISPGSQATGNLVHDSYPYFRYGHGIYTDQATSDLQIIGNLAYHTEGAIMYQHYGHNQTIKNNIFALATGGIGVLWQHANGMAPGDELSDLRFERNIVLVDERVGESLFGDTWLGNSTFEANLYFNASASSVSGGWPSWIEGSKHGHGVGAVNRTFAAWKASGQDTASRVNADPKFTRTRPTAPLTPADFVLEPSSPALQPWMRFDPSLVTAVADTTGVGPAPAHRFEWRPVGCTKAAADASVDTDAPFSCGPPGTPVNGSVSGNGVWSCGDVAVWHCQVGTMLSGATFASCESNGWSAPPPKCVPAPVPTCLQTESAMGTNKLVAGNAAASMVSTGTGAAAHFAPISMLRAPEGGFFITQQSDGNLCVYKGSGPTNNHGEVWCSGGPGPKPKPLPGSSIFTVLQMDGNLCTYSADVGAASVATASPVALWCSGSAICKPQSTKCDFWAALGDEGRFCIHRGTACEAPASASAVWCSPAPA